MAQIFNRSTNTISKVSILGSAFILAAVSWLLTVIFRSDYLTGARVVREQPVPFSHKHHVSGLGIDCRYCHTSVENFILRRPSADRNLHELSFADLVRKLDARACARQLPNRPAAPLDKGARFAEFRLLQP